MTTVNRGRLRLAAKRALLASIVEQASDAAGQAIARRESKGPTPLSFAQQRLWFLYRLEPDSPWYNVSSALRLRGELNAEILQQSLQRIVDRHESLRTTFHMIDGEPMQIIADQGSIGLEVTDLTSLPEAQRGEQLKQIVRSEAAHAFDLERGPLARVRLVRTGELEHLLTFTMHHIICDGWSWGVLMKELSDCYGALAQGLEPSLPALPVQYADYALWHRQWLEGEALKGQLEYWTKQLKGAPALLELPTDRPRPPVRSSNGKSRYFDLPTNLVTRLKELSQQENATLFMTLLAAYQALLFRYSGQRDILVGTPVANRPRGEVEGLVGMFANTLVLRTDLSGSPTFRQLLRQVREAALDAFSNQDVPFEMLVERLAPERNRGYTPLFQVMFALHNTPGSEPVLPGLQAEQLAVDLDAAKCDLLLSMAETGGGFKAQLQYSTDLFDEATIDRMWGHYQSLLERIAASPDSLVEEIDLLSEAEHAQLREWTGAKSNYPREALVPQVFEEQAARAPHAIALVYGEDRLTYGELNRQANRLAHYLRRQGVGGETLVGVCMDRSMDLVVALLAILKAGGAYLPLDPNYPAERIHFMLEDGAVPVLLADSHLAAKMPEHRAQVVCLDGLALTSESDENPPPAAGPESRAYVNYTSGSTGRPKGVMVPHRAVLRLVRESNFLAIGTDDVFLQLAPVSFDAATLEIWGPLLNGARLAIMAPGTPTLGELGGALRRYGVTTVWMTAGLFHLMVDEQLDALRQVRNVLAGGDVLSLPHVRRLLAAMGEEGRLINGYGPTENTTFTCCHTMRPDMQFEGSVPIGRPIANTSVYILDQRMQPVPVGVPGELYTGGDGLALGYLNRPELTEERFVPNPFGEGRLYRTGDLVRWRPDGSIEFLGRMDNQVKIRGFRIELGEVEVALAQHPGLSKCVVVAREDIPGDKRLVAYVVPAGNLSADELRAFLKSRLPEYMAPSAYVLLEDLPLDPNGKVDRRALPVPQVQAERTAERVAPRDELERKLVSIWEEVIGTAPIGVEDNFFDLGGHSLMAVRLLGRVEQALGRSVPLASLFAEATVAHLARVIRQGDEAPSSSSVLVGIRTTGALPPLFCVHGGFGSVFCFADLARELGSDQPFYGLQPQGLYDQHDPLDRLEEMAALYVQEVRSVQQQGPYYLAGYCMGGPLALEMARQLKVQGESVALVAMLDSKPPGEPVRVSALPEEEFLFWLVRSLARKDEAVLQAFEERFAALPMAERLAWGLELADKERILPPGITSPEQFHRWVRMYQANVRAFAAYPPRGWDTGRFILFVAQDQELPDPTLGWESAVPNGCEIEPVPGDHFTLLDPPHANVLAERWKQRLAQAREGA